MLVSQQQPSSNFHNHKHQVLNKDPAMTSEKKTEKAEDSNSSPQGSSSASKQFSGLDTLTYVATTVDRHETPSDKDSKPSTESSPTPESSNSTNINKKLPSLTSNGTIKHSINSGSALPPPIPQSGSPSQNQVLPGPMSISSLTNPADEKRFYNNGSSVGFYSMPIGAPPPPAGSSYLPTNGSSPTSTVQQTSSGRKKKQCSTCHGWFSNLATHKSIHLADNSRPHSCEVCGRGFARPNDLFRHMKSHRGDAPFRCPLYTKTATVGPNSGGFSSYTALEPTCHQNGGFSRCDTYKNHLKAMHFEYPAGTKKRDRSGMSGKCKGCGLSFASTEAWITDHIESGQCEGVKRIRAMESMTDS